MSVDTDAPGDMLAAHPETAYFWGRVAGDGECDEHCVTVRTTDEIAARRLASIAGADRTGHRTVERAYAHDTSIVRTDDEYTLQVFGDLADRAGAALGLPFAGEAGGYRFETLAEYDRQLLRGLLEACGTVCFKSDADVVGVSFVHADRRLLRTVQSLLAACPVDVPCGDCSEASSGYWFGVDDDAVPALGDWLYDGSEATGLFAPSRRRKLRKSLERVR
ncbi:MULTISPECIES: cobalamin biosynthesis protein [Haloarcula]|uniref:cobalamin biosynthesis protein n=1 Tax=Haloarcula TaxID=2237 RepID=UPI0023EBC3DD|nr:cobalamin biosynthesis protein [Halomicroarcula sp. XH51]